MPKSSETTYHCEICKSTRDQNSHHKAHLETDKHRGNVAQFKLDNMTLELIDLTNKYPMIYPNNNYAKLDINTPNYNGVKNKFIDMVSKKLSNIKTVTNKKLMLSPEPELPVIKYDKTNILINKLTDDEIMEMKKDEGFKAVFKHFLDKCHNILRSNGSVTGINALDDIIYTFMLCYLGDKVTSDTEGTYNFGNLDKSYYRNRGEKNKVKDYIKYLNIEYLLNHVCELRLEDNMDAIKKIGYILSKHPPTKGVIRDDNFINCKDPIGYATLLTEIYKFSKEHNIFTKNDLIGLAYEYFVNDYGDGGGGHEGQFFTERPLINMTLKLIDDEDIKEFGIDDNSTIGDEFCATLGYPINLKKYLFNKYKINIKDKNIYGIEQNDRLSRLAKLNAMLSLENSKNIKQGDSFITNVKPHLDIGVYNVPFGKNSIYDLVKEKYSNTEGLPKFEDIFKSKGPLAVMASQLAFYKVRKIGLCIIKDGEETSSTKNKKYRKDLCDNYVIKKILKIPSGTFSSTGTATVCIYFVRKEGCSTEKIQFLQLNKDCNQINEICNVTITDLKQQNYSWDPNVYLVDEKLKELMSKSKCEFKMLKDVCEIQNGERVVKKHDSSENGQYYVYGGGNATFKVNKFNREKSCKISRFGASSKNCVTILNEKYFLNDSGFTIISKNKTILDGYLWYYLYYYLTNNKEIFPKLWKGGGQKNIDIEQFKSIILLPIPKPEIQEKCVEQLNDLSNQKSLINDMKTGIKRQMKYFIDSQIQKSVNDNNVEFKTIKDVYEIIYGNRNKENISDTESYPCLGGGEKVSKYTNKWNIPKDTIIIARSGSCGSISIFDVPCLLGSYAFFLKMNSNIDNVNNMYMYYYLKNIEDEIKNLGKGGNQKNINRDELYKFPIQIPKLEIQESITLKMNELSDKIKNLDNDILFIDNLMKEIMTSTYQ